MLKARGKITPQVTSETDMYHCCRWCHYFNDGKCYANVATIDEDNYMSNPVYKVAEDGYLHDAVEEAVGSVDFSDFKELEYLLRGWNISEKRVKEFKKKFEECTENYKRTLIPEVEDSVDMCYQVNTDPVQWETGIVISEPEDFSCEKWC